jgi:hypothetical protein
MGFSTRRINFLHLKIQFKEQKNVISCKFISSNSDEKKENKKQLNTYSVGFILHNVMKKNN